MKTFSVICIIYITSFKIFGENDRFQLEYVFFSRLHFINELYGDWAGAFRFPVKSLTLLPSIVRECWCSVGVSYCLDCLRSLMGYSPIHLKQVLLRQYKRQVYMLPKSVFSNINSLPQSCTRTFTRTVLAHIHLQMRTYLTNNSSTSWFK